MKNAALVLAIALLPGPAPVQSEPFDILLSGGTVLDGSGGPPRRADIGIVGDRIMAIGDLSRAGTRERFNASGLYVAPGFINVHDHSEPGQHAEPIGLVSQGITTAIGNPDGWGPVNILAPLDGVAPGINYGAYIGFNSIWSAIVGEDDRRPTPDEIVEMRNLVKKGLTEGAFGVSAGLDYKPAFFATTAEVTAIVSAAKDARTNFPNHDRIHAGNGFSSLAGQDETIRIASDAGLMPVITHMHMLSSDRGKAEEAFGRIRAWQNKGVAIGADAYPYTEAATALEQILIPAWAQAGGRTAMLKRFEDPRVRAQIVSETNAMIAARIRGPANLRLPDMKRELTDLVAEWGVSPGEAIVRLLEQGQRNVIIRSVTEEDRTRILADPITAISCDCGAIASKTGHPRNWGAYPRFFGHYVREQRIASWAEGVRRATALPAAMIGLVERGWLRPGMIADITLFDPRTIAGRSTLDAPTQISAGVSAVLINGRFAWRNGAFVPRAGVVLRRGTHEPSRQMRPAARHRLTADLALSGGGRLRVRAAMDGHGAAIKGRATISSMPNDDFVLDRPGLLQTAPGWAALTGLGRDAAGRTRAATLIVDMAEHIAGRGGRIVLLVDGRALVDAAIAHGSPHILTKFPFAH